MKYCADTWYILEIFEGIENAKDIFQNAKQQGHILVPVIVYAESFKKLMQKGMNIKAITDFFETAVILGKISIIAADTFLATEAAKISLTFNLPLMDSFVAATAKLYNCDFLLAADSDYNLLIKKKYIKIKNW